MLTGCRNIFRKHMSLSVLIAATSCECVVIINHHTDSDGMQGIPLHFEQETQLSLTNLRDG